MAFLLILSATTGCKNKIDTTNSSKAVTTLACEAQQYSVNLTGRLSSSLDPLLLSQVGFLVSTSEGVNADNAEYTFPAVLYDRDFGVSVPIGSLGNQRGVRFYFVAFATDADKTYLGKVQSFQFPDIEVTGLNLTPSTAGTEVGKTVQLYASVTPPDATDQTVTWSSSDKSIASVSNSGLVTGVAKGKATISASAGGFTQTCEVTVKSAKPAGAVDLGLSVFWAEKNLGAAHSYDAGDHYAWGETTPKTSYDPSNCKIWNTTTNTWVDRYQKSGTLLKQDDAAAYKLGGNWRIPTVDEFEELRDNCTLALTKVSGKWGIMFTSKINGNTLFIPNAGYYNSNEYHYVNEEGGTIYYWTATWWASNYGARVARMGLAPQSQYADKRLLDFVLGSPRYEGYPFRPVSD